LVVIALNDDRLALIVLVGDVDLRTVLCVDDHWILLEKGSQIDSKINYLASFD
jgi:hypothetical protein